MDASLRKAAVLISCLDKADADRLMTHLGAVPANRIRAALEAIGTISTPEREQVIHEFLRHRPPSDQTAAGVELDPGLQSRLTSRHTDASSPQDAALARTGGAETPFAFLLETEADVVAPFLARESPQTVAVVLSYLRRSQAAKILQRLDPSLQSQVLRRLAHLEEIEPACVDVVAAELQAWLDRQRHTRSIATGEGLVRDLLASGPDADRGRAIAEFCRSAAPAGGPEPRPPAEPQRPKEATGQQTQVEKQEPSRAASTLAREPANEREERRRPRSFGDLVYLGDEQLRRVLQAIPHDLLTLALAGADDHFVQQLTRRLPRRDRKRLRQAVKLNEPTRLADMESAKQEVARVITEMLADHADASAHMTFQR